MPRNPRPHRRAAAAALAAALLAAGCSGSTSADDRERDGSGATDRSTPAAQAYPGVPDDLAQQRLEWESCGAPTELQGEGQPPGELDDGTPWQCAELTVPLDWSEPGGDTIDLALIRAESSSRDGNRVGSLVFNFGGPGASGVFTMPLVSEDYASLRTGFDLVSFDPRGVGESAGVVCFDGEQQDAVDQEHGSLPQTPEDEAALEKLDEQYIAACEENSGDVLPHVTTTNTARDLDLLRHVLGDTKLHYFGISYGTELGGVYANLFPERVGRAVLDAVVDPTGNLLEQSLQQAEGFQLALENYMADCAGQDPEGCPTGSGPEEGNEILAGLLAGLAEEPLPTEDDRDLTQTLAVTGIAAALYSEETWPYLTTALELALEGRGDVLLLFADAYNGRGDDGTYSNQNAAHVAIRCADSSAGLDRTAVDEHRDEFLAASPVFGEFLVWSLTGCDGWPVEGESDNPEVSAEGSSEILLIATTGDPATPYAGAERMQQELGEGVGILLTYDGEGHGAYNGTDPCITEAVDEYLLAGMVPKDGLVCG
ncbi:alpha/beta hydrolase [Streptomyces sp. ACA25]|uniref:alpha/beta hydrolase n=1 Tax=Streptomyces sp. ACA25 TaxID=3022596 RepID=UPI003FA7CD79